MCALVNKINKQLQKPAVRAEGICIRKPVVISDSKGNYLKDWCYTNEECEIKWICRNGGCTARIFDWFRGNLDNLIKEHKKVAIYIWSGTCDLTIKKGQCIQLRSHCAEPDASIYEDFHNIRQLVAHYDRDVVHLTLLEVPIYSISKWNSSKGHTNPKIFVDQDKILMNQIEKLNDVIKINLSLNTYSPRFSQDLLNNRKSKSQTKGKYSYSVKAL